MKHDTIPAPRRRDEALAIIIDRLVRTGVAPSYVELGAAMRPPVAKARAQQLVGELIEKGIVEKVPGAQRALRVRDVAQARHLILEWGRQLGIFAADPLGDLQPPLPHVQLPLLPPPAHGDAFDGPGGPS